MCIGFLPVLMSVVRVSDSSGIGVIDGCGLPCGCWELKPGLLEEQLSDLNYRVISPTLLIRILR